MIGILVNGEFLDLFPDTRISLTLNNPLFADEEIIPGSYSLPFDIPGGDVSGKNARILGNPDLPETRAARLVFSNTIIYFDGLPYRKGELIVNPVSGKLYKANFNFGLKTIAENFRSAKIRDIIDEEIEMTTETYTKMVYAAPSGGASAPYKIRVNGEDFEGSTLSILAGAINGSSLDPAVTATYYSAGATPLGFAAPYITLTPTVSPTDPERAFHVDSEGGAFATRANWYIEVEDIDTYLADIKNFVEDYIVASPPDDKFRFPMAYNDGLYEEYKLGAVAVPKQGRKWINYAPDGTLTLNDPNYGATNTKPFEVYNNTNLQPFVMLRHVLDAIATEFGFTYEGDFFDDTYLSEAMFYSNVMLDIRMPYIGAWEYLFWKPSFNLRDFVPDLTVENLFKELQKKLNLGISYNEDMNKVRIIKRQPLFSMPPALDLTGISGPPTEIDDVSVPGVRLESIIDKKDLLAAEDFYESGTPELIIRSEFSSLEDDYVVGDYQFIRSRHKAGDEFTPRLVFYQGLDADGYPKASAVGWNMHYSGVTGLGAVDWKEYVRFLKNRKLVKRSMDIPFRILKAIDWEQIITVDRVNYFFKSLSTSLTMKGVEISEVELYSL